MPKIAICIPSQDDIPAPTVMSLISLYGFLLQHKLYQDEENDVNIFNERSSLLVASRQNLIQKALDWDAEWILMLDSDMTFPHDIVHQLAKHNLPVVACNYVKRIVPSVPITKDMNGELLCTNKDSTGLEKAKFTGFGVCLVLAEVFNKIPKPWFDTQWLKDDETGKVDLVGEDVFFFEALRHYTGLDLYIDHDMSQHIAHVGQFEYMNALGQIGKEEAEREESESVKD